MRLEDWEPGARVVGLAASGPATVLAVARHGGDAVEVMV